MIETGPAPALEKIDAVKRGIEERAALAARLRQEGENDLAEKLDACGAPLRLVCVCCGSKKSVEIRCRRRWCPACAWIVSRERIEKYVQAAATMQWPLFVTLTKPNSPDPECIRTIREDWSRMRRRKLMVDRIAGGISTIEVTNKGAGWHPHLHVLCDCRWLAIHTPPPSPRDSEGVKRQKYDHARLELSALWAQVIKNPVAVVSALRKPPGEALRYTLKYAVKGQDMIDCPDPIGPLIRVLSRSRMVSTFGTMHGRIAEDEEEERPAVECGECGNIKSFMPEDCAMFYGRAGHDLPTVPRHKYQTA
jgi:hypothetical protein